MSKVISENETAQKLRGGYYTPPAIARFLANWAVQNPCDEILEPSCGDGELLTAAAERLLALKAAPEQIGGQIQGVELFADEAARARRRLFALGIAAENCVSVGDFFDFEDQAWGLVGRRFDVAIGNPPFLRYHNFPEEQRERAFRIMRTAGLKPTRLTNAWAPFLVAASLRLKENGRLAMVIPAELLQVKYAEETRAFLARHFGSLTVITFRRLVFPDIQQEVVLLLAEKTPRIESGIDVIELEDADDLADYQVVLRQRSHLKTIDHAQEKWIKYYLDADEIELLRQAKRHPDLRRFGQLGCVDVGVVTGANAFFVLNREQVAQRELQSYTLPLIGRSAQLPGLVLNAAEWENLSEKNGLCHLLNLPELPQNELPDAAQAYIKQGETAGYADGFKCRNRKFWHAAPSLWIPDAFLFRQIHHYPKLVLNPACATSTDTIHRVRYHQPEQGAQITASFLNALTFAFSETMGRSYGGGVLELEPNEADALPIPYLDSTALDFNALDTLERAGNIEAILEITDAALLRDGLHFDAADIARFRRIWRKLSGRRTGRKTTRRKISVEQNEA